MDSRTVHSLIDKSLIQLHGEVGGSVPYELLGFNEADGSVQLRVARLGVERMRESLIVCSSLAHIGRADVRCVFRDIRLSELA